jgi:hypothetical protein
MIAPLWLTDRVVFNISAGVTVLAGHLQVTVTDEILGGDLFGWLVSIFTQAVPLPIVALVVFGTIGLAYYMVQRTFVIPVSMLLIVGAVTVAEFPPTFQTATVALSILGFTVVAYVLFNRVTT